MTKEMIERGNKRIRHQQSKAIKTCSGCACLISDPISGAVMCSLYKEEASFQSEACGFYNHHEDYNHHL